jgi:serine/threonine protein kinase/tetratricopeptide (TPR) repeat protein
MATNTDRHFLFGLLALQTSLIQQAQLVAAFHAWTCDKSRSLADHLIALGHLNDAHRAVVEALAELHVAKHGDVQQSLAAIPAGRSTRESLAQLGHPDIEGTLARVGSGSTQQNGDADLDRTASYAVGTTASYAVGMATSDGLRFRVLRPHARGGLGAVFVALDTELHREVALKQILESHSDDPTSRQRFLLEAEVTGGLEHPGIVPVYCLGTYGDGRPYYVMRFIREDSLKEAIEHFHAGESLKNNPGQRSLELRKLLRRFTDVCNAIDYAHSRDVLHRDIKPGNIIVGRHGETLVVDWGLAKATGKADAGCGERTLMPSSASGSSETLPGSALGTPAYMSPEQAEGDLEHLGARSDVYSLGATLYCLLTGRPPLEGDVAEVIRAVQRGEFRPPRVSDATIDRELEAICLKAMALKPENRCGSCRALAEDIERWMADEPVSAWREPLWRRMRRWAKRNRTAVTGAAVALVAGVVGLSAVLFVQTRVKADIARALDSETKANAALAAANGRVEQRYSLAMEEIKTFHAGVSEDFLLKEVTFKELRDRLLGTAPGFYGKLGALLGKESDVASRRALLQANFELAGLTAKVGQTEAALAAHRGVLAARRELAAEPAADVGVRIEVGRSQTAVARLLDSTGKTDEALAACREAETMLAGLSSPAARAELARSRNSLAGLLWTIGRSDEALATYRVVRADQEELAAAPGADKEARRDLADTINTIGWLLYGTGRQSDAEVEYRTALAILRKLADDNPAVTDFRSQIADSHNSLGNLHLNTGRPADAEVEYRQATAIYQRLADDNPKVPGYGDGAANTHLSVALRRLGRPAAAREQCEPAVAIREDLVREDPKTTLYRSGLAENYLNRGLARRALGEPIGAAADARRAVALFDALPSRAGEAWFLSACAHGALVGLAGRDGSGVSAAEDTSEAETAMALLHKAVDMGYRTPDAYRTEDALDPLRGREDFRLLMMDLAFPAEPFAGPK